MNEQMSFLNNVLASARTGNNAAVSLLRDVCRKAAEAAPANDLILIGQFLYDMRLMAAQAAIERN
jgi:hypothetical protein